MRSRRFDLQAYRLRKNRFLVTFHKTKLPGVYEIRLELKLDDRGFFARSWCQKEFEEHGLNPKLVQCSISFNARKGTLRGLHYQAAPYPEAKLVRCTRGAIYDVVVDLRPDSPTFKHWIGVDTHRHATGTWSTYRRDAGTAF